MYLFTAAEQLPKKKGTQNASSDKTDSDNVKLWRKSLGFQRLKWFMNSYPEA